MKKNKKWQLWTEIKTGSVESYTSKTQTQKPTAEGSVTRCKTQTVFCSILCSTLGYSLNLYLIKLRWFSDSTNVRPFFYPSTFRSLVTFFIRNIVMANAKFGSTFSCSAASLSSSPFQRTRSAQVLMLMNLLNCFSIYSVPQFYNFIMVLLFSFL